MDFEGNRQFAKYSSFRMAGEAEKYRLVLGAFTGGSAGECPPGPGPGRQRRGTRSPTRLCVFLRESGGASQTGLSPYVKKCYPHLTGPSRWMGPI